jgi:myo-inositol 2-dehydrogenase/D-chiro-inositol 1-dehydrogenase
MRVAVIGTGGIAQAHLRTLADEPGVEIVGHVSRSQASAEAAAQRWGGGAYTSLADLLTSVQVEAVWITTPPHVHGELELELIEHGVPFLVEKPLAADRGTPEKIAEALRASGLLAAVGYNWRAMNTVAEVRESLVANPPSLVIGSWHDTTPPPTWWHQQSSSGGQMVEQATHLIDLARHLVGEASCIAAASSHLDRAAYPDLDVATSSAALLKFASGAQGVFSATCLLHGPTDVSLKFVCDGLLITLTREGAIYESEEGRREVKLTNNSIKFENQGFLEAVTSGNRSRVYADYADALLTHRLCFDIVESLPS